MPSQHNQNIILFHLRPTGRAGLSGGGGGAGRKILPWERRQNSSSGKGVLGKRINPDNGTEKALQRFAGAISTQQTISQIDFATKSEREREI